MDLSLLGLKETSSIRVRVARNLTALNLTGAMSKVERIAFEKRMLGVFDVLSAEYGGRVFSLTPDFGDCEQANNPNLISKEEWVDLVATNYVQEHGRGRISQIGRPRLRLAVRAWLLGVGRWAEDHLVW